MKLQPIPNPTIFPFPFPCSSGGPSRYVREPHHPEDGAQGFEGPGGRPRQPAGPPGEGEAEERAPRGRGEELPGTAGAPAKNPDSRDEETLDGRATVIVNPLSTLPMLRLLSSKAQG